PITSGNEQTYKDIALACLVFAEELDTQWGANPIDIVEYAAVLDECSAYWYGRTPSSTSPVTYAITCTAVIAAAKELSAQSILAGYDPPAYPPSGGGGGVASVTATAPLVSSGGFNPNISLPPGADGDVLTVVAGVVEFAPPVAIGNATEFQSVPIEVGPPTVSEVYVGNVGGTEFLLRQLTQDDILPGFTIESFTVTGGTLEVGASVTNPAVTASYNQVPVSANVTNTDGTDSPLTLVSPFTSGTIVGTFTSAVPASVNATLTATNAAAVTKVSTITFLTFAYRTFAGVGTAGATSATASGTSAVLNGGAGTLPNAGLFGSIVGSAFSLTPASQNCYILTQHTATPHTWKDLNTGLPFAMNAPVTFAFTNDEGVTSSYDLYQSTNVLTANFDIEAVT